MTRHDPTIGAAVRSATASIGPRIRPSRCHSDRPLRLLPSDAAFLAALAWALALAVLAAPLRRRIEKTLKRPGLAAGVSILLLAAAVVIPRFHLHAVPTFIAIVGGLILFGASGLNPRTARRDADDRVAGGMAGKIVVPTA